MSETIHSLVPAYAVDALEPDERSLVERHLRECTDCREDLAAFRAATTALADAEAIAPPAALRRRVMAEVDITSQLTPDSADAPVTDPIRVAASFDATADDGTQHLPADAPSGRGDDLAERRGRRGVRRWLPALAGAAATVAIVAVGLGIAEVSPGNDSELAMEKDVMMVTSAPDATSMDLNLGNGHLVKSERMDAFALMGADAPTPEDGLSYQVWMILEDGSKIAGPTFMPGDGGEYMTVVHSDTDGVVAVAVTCEPHSGSTEPTTDMVSLVEL